MRLLKNLLASVAALATLATLAVAAEPIGAGLVMYMQMGGNPGEGATRARQTGAEQAAMALGVDLREQFAGWVPEAMISQFKEAAAAKPACIEVMGQPGMDAFHDPIKAAVDQGIVVTISNSLMADVQGEFKANGMGYAGVDLYSGGSLTAAAMLGKGLGAGDEAMVYGEFSEAESSQSETGLADTLASYGLKVDRLQITPDVEEDASLGVPVLLSYIPGHPNLKAIGTQNAAATSELPEILKQAGKKPGELVVGGIGLAPATVEGLKSGYVNATLDDLPYLQGYMPVLQCVLTAKYKMPGLSVDTGAGMVNIDSIGGIADLIEAGIR